MKKPKRKTDRRPPQIAKESEPVIYKQPNTIKECVNFDFTELNRLFDIYNTL